ncbi:hypothetical protein D9758_017045 [Tetrapyrgos nigripes]|uniref:carboxypeptidase C n=1 Tax=Tetrapyrgos nigripes TaxID=182062 RepID=A0A8H5CKJ2_9AGAR|nr:hypothetical protein D9758_017045 [Tetrapyrgos nigripes]
MFYDSNAISSIRVLLWLIFSLPLLVISESVYKPNLYSQEALRNLVYDSTAPHFDSDAPFTLLESLSFFNEDKYMVLSHPNVPRHGVRIKKTRFCDDTVNTYTGYIDINPVRHLFFYFFESKSSPEKDDIIVWMNGGPGCSSTLGLFFENGPCKIISNGTDTTTEFNPLSWNTNANIFFPDQPVGTGFSYSEGQYTVNTAEEAAKDLYAFLAIFFAHAKEFRVRRLHLAGESYVLRNDEGSSTTQ